MTFLICNGSFQDKTTFSEGIYHDWTRHCVHCRDLANSIIFLLDWPSLHPFLSPLHPCKMLTYNYFILFFSSFCKKNADWNSRSKNGGNKKILRSWLWSWFAYLSEEKPEVRWKTLCNMVTSQLLKFSTVVNWGEVKVKSQLLGNQLAFALYQYRNNDNYKDCEALMEWKPSKKQRNVEVNS